MKQASLQDIINVRLDRFSHKIYLDIAKKLDLLPWKEIITPHYFASSGFTDFSQDLDYSRSCLIFGLVPDVYFDLGENSGSKPGIIARYFNLYTITRIAVILS